MMLEALGTWVQSAYLLSIVPLTAAWLLSLAVARQRASIRHHVWVVGLTIALLAPVTRMVAPRVNVPLLRTPAVTPEAGERPVSAEQSPTSVGSGHAFMWDRDALQSRPAGDIPPPTVRSSAAIIAIAWLAGAVPLLFMRGLRRARLARITTKARALDQLRRIRTHERIVVPMLAGLRRPVILLPTAAAAWPERELEAVLAHERAHLVRRDHVIAVIRDVATAVYWLNPLVWLASAAMARERELACDEEVLHSGIKPSAYAAALLRVAQSVPSRAGVSGAISEAPAMTGSGLDARVRAVLADTPRSGRVPLSWLTTAAVIVLSALAVGSVHLVARTPIRPTAFELPVATLGNAPARESAPPGVPLVPVASFQSSSASGRTATFSGSLLDTLGQGLPNRPLVLTNVSTGAKHQGKTDRTGHFIFTGLEAGEYDLDAPVPGFVTHYRVTLPAGTPVERNLTLQLGSLHAAGVTNQQSASTSLDGTVDPQQWLEFVRKSQGSLRVTGNLAVANTNELAELTELAARAGESRSATQTDRKPEAASPPAVQSVTVIGEVRMPGRYAITGSMSLLDALVDAGMPTSQAAAQVEVLRADGTRTSVDARDLTAVQAFLLRPGDIVSVPKTQPAPPQFVTVLGEVRNPGRYPITGSKSLLEALADAGALSGQATREVAVIHPNGTRTSIDLREITAVNAYPLHDGDVVTVPKVSVFYLSGEVRNPGAYVWQGGMTLAKAVTIAGGLTGRGTYRKITATRIENGKVTEVVLDEQTMVLPDDQIKVLRR